MIPAEQEIITALCDGAPQVEIIYHDKQYGHILLHGAAEGSLSAPFNRDASFVDLGPVLHLWSGQGCNIDPTRARELASALTWWADRAENRS